MQMPSPCTASEVRCVKRELLCMEISRLSVTLQMKDVWCVTAELGGLLWVENTPHTQNAHTLTHTHALTQACTVCDSFVSTLSVLLSLMNISLVASPTEFAPLAGSLPHIQFFNRDGSENGHVVSTNLCESLKKSALVFFCWHYSNLVSFLSPGYTWSITQWFIFKSGSIFSPFSGPETKNVENFCQKKKKWTQRGIRTDVTRTHTHTQRREETGKRKFSSPLRSHLLAHRCSGILSALRRRAAGILGIVAGGKSPREPHHHHQTTRAHEGQWRLFTWTHVRGQEQRLAASFLLWRQPLSRCSVHNGLGHADKRGITCGLWSICCHTCCMFDLLSARNMLHANNVLL